MLKKHFNVFLVVFMLGIAISNAQQDPYYSQFMFNRLTTNPGYTGGNSRDKICFTALVKRQWVRFPGSPTTQNININTPLGKKHGLGLVIENIELGFEKRLNFGMSYAYRINLPNQQGLGIGVFGGLYQAGLAGDKLKPLSTLLNLGTDPNLPSSTAVGMKPDVSFGVNYTKQNLGPLNDFFVGLSARHLMENTIEYATQAGNAYNVFKMRTHVYIQAGAEYPLSGGILIPSVLIRYDKTKMQLELNANYMMNNKMWFGGSYRNDKFRGEALIAQGGYKITKDLKAGIAYDLTLNRLGPIRTNSFGSVEFMVQYCFNVKFKDYSYKEYRDTRRQGGWRL